MYQFIPQEIHLIKTRIHIQAIVENHFREYTNYKVITINSQILKGN